MHEILLRIASEPLIHSFVLWVEASKYILLFLGAIVEGPVLMVSSGFLWRIGQLDFWPMYFALMLGDFVADVCWYAIGRHGARRFIDRFGHHFNLTPRVVEKIEDRFRRYHTSILIINKLTMGFGFAIATLMVAGMLKVPFLRYVVLNFLGGFVWTFLLIMVGFGFGNIYGSLAGPMRAVFVVALIAGAFFAFRLANEYLMKKEL